MQSCVHFWVKVSNIDFLIEKCILFKKKNVSIFFLAVLSHGDVTK